MKIAIFSTCNYDQQFLTDFNTGHELSFFAEPLSLQNVMLTKGFDALCLFVNDHANAQVFAKLEENGIRLILLRCAGFNNIDLTAAAAAGIKVLRVPAYSPQAVAEHAMAMVLTLNRKTHKAHNRTREGNFSLEGLMGFNLHGAKVALIGTGNIGKAFYHILKGFGCQVMAYDPKPDQELMAKGLQYGTLAEVLADAVIVSLHCPLVPENHHMINSTTLQFFKKGAMLINTSRGGLINTPEVITALKSGHLGYLGIDVYEQESKLFFADHSAEIMTDELIARLMSFPNVLITAHQGFFTKNAMEQIAGTTYSNADAFVAGIPLANEVYE
ncbi:2-hydroxyacid dehydrogenase [Pedobacter frigiditerrae]|uniref:2-hydroxyacid dehydrogenase n=1 Tax=Pedobacter frigiditerrae TaxID=2530452 RepID=A0A4R0MMV2_9SPHI|nr:2-hydroxyacid dehydrogenase [Pedobacter frigiditerrae]TCC88050.1 2-hydroxyacid dehydrogenase [Pedobacter frigiditerrae]